MYYVLYESTLDKLNNRNYHKDFITMGDRALPLEKVTMAIAFFNSEIEAAIFAIYQISDEIKDFLFETKENHSFAEKYYDYFPYYCFRSQIEHIDWLKEIGIEKIKEMWLEMKQIMNQYDINVSFGKVKETSNFFTRLL